MPLNVVCALLTHEPGPNIVAATIANEDPVPPVMADTRHAQLAHLPPVRYFALDGFPYTFEEFAQYYGFQVGLQCWYDSSHPRTARGRKRLPAAASPEGICAKSSAVQSSSHPRIAKDRKRLSAAASPEGICAQSDRTMWD